MSNALRVAAELGVAGRHGTKELLQCGSTRSQRCVDVAGSLPRVQQVPSRPSPLRIGSSKRSCGAVYLAERAS